VAGNVLTCARERTAGSEGTRGRGRGARVHSVLTRHGERQEVVSPLEAQAQVQEQLLSRRLLAALAQAVHDAGQRQSRVQAGKQEGQHVHAQ